MLRVMHTSFDLFLFVLFEHLVIFLVYMYWPVCHIYILLFLSLVFCSYCSLLLCLFFVMYNNHSKYNDVISFLSKFVWLFPQQFASCYWCFPGKSWLFVWCFWFLMDVCFLFSCMFAFRFSLLYILSYRINILLLFTIIHVLLVS